MQEINLPDRRFSLHLYWTSHGLLLLRSAMTAEHPTRMDVLFSDVIWMSLPAWMPGLLVSEIEVREVLPYLPPSLHAEAAERRAYRVLVEETPHFVVCGGLRTAEDQADYFAPSELLPGLSLPDLR